MNAGSPTTGQRSRLNAAEEALWSLQQLVPDRGVSNAAIGIELERSVRWWPVQTAVDLLVARHPALRSRFPTVGGMPVRRELDATQARIVVDVRTCAAGSLEAELREYAAEPFDLATGPVIRVGQFVVEQSGQVLCVVAHHIVIDATSIRTVAVELDETIAALSAGQPAPATSRQLSAVSPAGFEPSEEAVSHWRSRLAGFEPGGMRLAEARASTASPTFSGALAALPFPASRVNAALAVLRKQCRATDATVLLAAYYLTLYLHGAAEDAAVGVLMDTRKDRSAADVGYHVVTLPQRVRVHGEQSFAELVAQVSGELVAGLERGPVPFELLAADHTTPDPAAPPAGGDDPSWWRYRLVRHLFNFRPANSAHAPLVGRPRLREVNTGLSRFDLELIAARVDGQLDLQLLHSTEVHDTPFAERFLERLELALEQAAADPGRALRDFDLRGATDRRVVNTANQTERSWPPPPTVLGAITEAARGREDAVAIVDGNQSTTYGQLFAAARAIREAVLKHSTAPGPMVAIAGRRGAGVAAAVLGVWSAGASYLPIDPNSPPKRLAAQLAETRCQIVVGAEDLAAECRRGRVCLPLPDLRAPVGHRGPLPEPAGDGTAYVIFTSGSSGRPKGVRLTHANLINVIRHFAAELDVTQADSMAWLTTFAFDISALELCLPLAAGGRVVVADDDAPARPDRLLGLIERENVSVIQATPTTWRLTAARARGKLVGRTVLCGGEPLTPALARDLLATGARVINVYGPTETTIWSTAAEVTTAAEPITIGRPIANTQVQVLDARGRPQPIGMAGELCIAGAGVAAGYHERPELTAQRFRIDAEIGRYYRTGDRARWLAGGVIELLGRTDRQVKLRAHRIELGEVEAILERHPTVSAAAVVISGDPAGDGVIAAFVKAAGSAATHARFAAELWVHAAGALPSYSVPSSITLVDAMPLTHSGKVDYNALAVRPAEGARETVARPAAPADDPLEKGLVTLWQAVLGRSDLGRDSNFFLSGGHSLLAVRLAEATSERLGRNVTMAMVFRAPTPAALAALARKQAVS